MTGLNDNSFITNFTKAFNLQFFWLIAIYQNIGCDMLALWLLFTGNKTFYAAIGQSFHFK